MCVVARLLAHPRAWPGPQALAARTPCKALLSVLLVSVVLRSSIVLNVISIIIVMCITIMIIAKHRNTGVCETKFLLGEPLPCNPSAETAIQPLIWCSEGLYS